MKSREFKNSKRASFQGRKQTISNSKISKLPQSKKFKFTNLKILNSETSHTMLSFEVTIQFVVAIN